MKKTKLANYIGYFFALLLVALLFCILYSHYLDKQIAKIYPKASDQLMTESTLDVRQKGKILSDKSIKDSKMTLLGSSELSAPVSQNPLKLFPNTQYPYNVSFFGHECVQNYNDAIFLGANSQNLVDNHVVIIESLQWFYGYEVNTKGLLSNFSELQFYQFLHNDKISKKNKDYLCRRIMEIEHSDASSIDQASEAVPADFFGGLPVKFFNGLKRIGIDLKIGDVSYPQTYFLARSYISDSVIGKFMYQISRPYYYARYKFLELKDKRDTYQYLKTIKPKKKKMIDLNWDKAYKRAEKEGKEACTNNDLYVYDDYYVQNIQGKSAKLKDSNKGLALMESREWNDYEFFLSVCDDLGIKPYIVMASTNGKYYDFIGLPKNERDELYDTVQKKAKEHDVEVLSLKDHEYEPYFYCDVMHLGWKGWTYVEENIINHFAK